uniref:LRRNT domain-containing protein n=1 Tax=Branchiostoma floridae TaxID=7739 RepID=C3ZL39_BRAFL|eukprot:XP_002590710.1 hypothetical protein BRAFLDRAFT_89516 [Branchiostoma floridae]
MGKKLRHLLIFLLIILKEPNLQVDGWWRSTPKADCKCAPSTDSCAPSPRCDCGNLGLTSIPKNLPKSICSLDLSTNKIKKIQPGAFSNLPRLQVLKVINNQIRNIQPGTFANLPQLEELRLADNDMTLIQPGVFSNLPRLQSLELSRNQIKMIQPGTFANLPQLKTLDLSDNQMGKSPPGLFTNIPQLEELYLNRYQIMILPGLFANIPQLKELYLSSNQLTKIHPGTFANLPGLEKLVLASNQITMIQEGAYPTKLQYLDLRSNKISAITPLAYADIMTRGHDQATTGTESNTKSTTESTSATVVTSGHDHQYEDVDKQHDQTEQGMSQANTESLIVENLSHNDVLAALNPNPMYTGQGQSQAFTKSNTNTTATVVSTVYDHQYKDIDTQHDQKGKGQSQAITESLDSRNESYGTGPTALQPNPLYKCVDQHQADRLNDVPSSRSTPRDDGIYVKPDDALNTRPEMLYEMPPNKICKNDMLYCQPPANT